MDDDGDGTTDGTIGSVGEDDDGDGTTDEDTDKPEKDESPAMRLSTGNAGYGNADGTGFWAPGTDGKPGVAAVDDDGNGTTDDVGETGWAGSDDTDDLPGRVTWEVWMNTNLHPGPQRVAKGIFLHMYPVETSTTWQFSLGEMHEATLYSYGVELGNELGTGFYDPHKRYNWAFCRNGVEDEPTASYGAILWTGADMANPNETLGPIERTWHSGADDNLVGFRNGVNRIKTEAGEWKWPKEVYVRRHTWTVNSNFSHTFWVISGDTTEHYPSVSADLDNDRDVDGQDFLTFSTCYNGSLHPPRPACANMDADLDLDGDVDGQDWLSFSCCYNGSLKKPLPGCFPPNMTATCGASCTKAKELTPVEGTITVIDRLTPCALTSSHSCVANQGEDLWYKYKPGEECDLTISVCETADLPDGVEDLFLAVYYTCGGDALACTDSGGCPGDNPHETVVLNDVGGSGETIYIAVGSASELDGSYEIKLVVTGCPTGEEKSSAGEGGEEEGWVLPVIVDGESPALDRWYAYTPTCSGAGTMSFCVEAGKELPVEKATVLVYDGAGFVTLGCEADDGCLACSEESGSLTLSEGEAINFVLWADEGVEDLGGARLGVSCK